MSSGVIEPFPWNSLEAMSRAGVSALREARQWAARHVRLDACVPALADLIGADVRVFVRRATLRAGGPAIEHGVAVLAARAGGDGGDRSGGALLEVEAALAVAVVSRALRRPPARITDLTSPPTAALAGALAAVAVAALRRAHAGAAPRVLAAGGAEALEAEFARDHREVLALSLTVLVDDDAYAARLVLARDEAFAAPPTEWTRRGLSSLGAMPLSVPVVACATVATLADLAALREGDAWLPGTWSLDRPRGAGGLRGPVLLAAPSAATGVRARLVEDGRLVLSGEVDAVCAAEGVMTESDGNDALLSAVGDVPVVVRVEIGEARMAAREWAALSRGDVVTLGRRVGDLVLLRVGGVPVARGELVNVDGEVGVRIAERIAGDPTRAST